MLGVVSNELHPIGFQRVARSRPAHRTGGHTSLSASPSTPNEIPARDQARLRQSFILIGLGWTAAVCISLGWVLSDEWSDAVALARQSAITAYEKDTLYRRWNSEHGGVYVPVTKDTRPNPALQSLPERDIETPSGRQLTLVNHAYMIRQVYEMNPNGPEGRLVSLTPINPKNSPDPWESEALRSFSAGRKESDAVQVMNGQRRLRLVRPLVLEGACIRCHAAQGHREGDIYGGMSITLAMAPYEAGARAGMVAALIGHAGLWLVGLTGIFLAWHSLRERMLERQQAMVALADALGDKAVLLQELQHRVKNNLQVISSLLNLEADSLPDAAQGPLRMCVRRVQSMALIHNQLYGKEDLGRLDFGEYAKGLTSDLFQAYCVRSEVVRLRLDLDPILLDVKQAIPCGLILNELLTNSLKYAFPGGRAGEILVALHCQDNGLVSLRVADNGVGLPPGFDWKQSKSLGLRIVNILASQLNGTVRHEAEGGAGFTLTFAKQTV